MHRVTRVTRKIADADLPRVVQPEGGERPATEADLLNMDIVPLGGGYYACQRQERRGLDSLVWSHIHPEHPGDVVSVGTVEQRYGSGLADEHRPHVLRSRVFRETSPDAPTAVAVVSANLSAVAEALTEYVGDGYAVDTDSAAARVEEARRLAALDSNGIVAVTVRMVEVDHSADIVEAEGLIPHMWAGERRR